MKDLQFTASDFSAAPTGNAGALADWANKKLARKLEKATVVWGSEDRDFGVMVYFDDKEAPYAPTHKARLVCIEELKP
jgi:hypothetical protein